MVDETRFVAKILCINTKFFLGYVKNVAASNFVTNFASNFCLFVGNHLTNILNDELVLFNVLASKTPKSTDFCRSYIELGSGGMVAILKSKILAIIFIVVNTVLAEGTVASTASSFAWTSIGQAFSASAAASREIIFAIREQALARQLAECAILHARAVFKSAILIGMNARSENVIYAARLRYFESRKIVGLRVQTQNFS